MEDMKDIEALENIKKRSNSIFKAYTNSTSVKGEEKKENRRKSNERKRKRTETNVQRVYGICVEDPLGNDVPQCLVYPLAWPSRKSVSKSRMLPHWYLDEMGHTSHSFWKGIISAMQQEAESPPTFSKKSETMFTPSCTPKSAL